MAGHFERAEAFFKKALDLWSSAGVDPVEGDFLTALSQEAVPRPDEARRGRVQARQILVFAMAHALGDDPDGRYLKVARRGYQALRRRYLHPDGGLMFLVAPDGSVIDDHRFAYEQAFLLMAQGWLARATGEASFATDAETLWGWLEDRLGDRRHGGFAIGIPGDQDSPRQQNPHMHLFEACLLNDRNIVTEPWRSRAEALARLFQTGFFDPSEGCIREFFTEDWRPDPTEGERLDPGHHFEWVWLLGQRASLTGQPAAEMAALYDYGLRHGLGHDGQVLDEIRTGGRPGRATARLWLQCELVKAHLAMQEHFAIAGASTAADEALGLMLDHYLLEDSGCWADQLDANGQTLPGDSPASTLYHLYGAFAEYRRLKKA